MKYVFKGKKMEITEALKERAVKKLSKLEKFFHADTEAIVTLAIEKNRQIVEVTIPFNSMLIRAEAEGADMYGALDLVVNKLEGQVRRNKTRLEKRLHAGTVRPHYFSAASADMTADNKADEDKSVEDTMIDEEIDFHVARSKKFAVKPMTVEEAILQMNLLDHVFFIFLNEDTQKLNVVYRRKNGDYGILEPEW